MESEAVWSCDRKRRNLGQPLPRGFGVQESEINSSLVNQRAVRGIGEPGEQRRQALRWTLRGHLRTRSCVCLG